MLAGVHGGTMVGFRIFFLVLVRPTGFGAWGCWQGFGILLLASSRRPSD